jgi:hypothetical protein
MDKTQMSVRKTTSDVFGDSMARRRTRLGVDRQARSPRFSKSAELRTRVYQLLTAKSNNSEMKNNLKSEERERERQRTS